MKIFKIIIIYSLIAVIVSLLVYVIYNAMTIEQHRIVHIEGHEYIETGFRYTTLIHSESCNHPSHKIE